MTTVPVEEIRAQARQVHFSLARAAVTFLAALFFLPGWVAGRAWYCAAFAATAVRVGFREGAKLAPRQPAGPPGQ